MNLRDFGREPLGLRARRCARCWQGLVLRPRHETDGADRDLPPRERSLLQFRMSPLSVPAHSHRIRWARTVRRSWALERRTVRCWQLRQPAHDSATSDDPARHQLRDAAGDAELVVLRFKKNAALYDGRCDHSSDWTFGSGGGYFVSHGSAGSGSHFTAKPRSFLRTISAECIGAPRA